LDFLHALHLEKQLDFAGDAFLKERNKELESWVAFDRSGYLFSSAYVWLQTSSIRIGESSHPAGRAVFPDETFHASVRRTP
jgi:hypothetical protein